MGLRQSNVPTPHDRLLQLISDLADRSGVAFDAKTEKLSHFVGSLPDAELRILLGECGFIPESYEHDSSEEKVYAKAMDICVAIALSKVGFKSSVATERSNMADVLARAEGEHPFSLVLDAKAFRLSRTALNPKDYKIEALNTWRHGADYACLVGPLAGFPEGRSRLYEEAARFNVTLLTFSHLQFVLDKGVKNPHVLLPLLDIGQRLPKTAQADAAMYWSFVNREFCRALNTPIAEWRSARRRYLGGMLAVAEKQVAFFKGQKESVSRLTREQLVSLAVRALKFDNKMAVIRAKARKAETFLKSVEEAED